MDFTIMFAFFLTPGWVTFFKILAIVCAFFSVVFGGFDFFLSKNLPIKYQREAEINSVLNIYENHEEDDTLWKASKFFTTVPKDHLTDRHHEKITAILLANMDNKGRRYNSLMELNCKILSPKNDALFIEIVENDKSDPSFVQHYAFEYFLRRESIGLNPQLLSLIHYPKYTSPSTSNFKLISFLSSSIHLSKNSNSAAIFLANNKIVIDELIDVQGDWFEKYTEFRNANLNNGVNALDIDAIIEGTYLAQKVAEKRIQALEDDPVQSEF